MGAIELLAEAQKAGLEVMAQGNTLIVRGPRSLESLALKLLDAKSEVLPLLLPDGEALAAELDRLCRLGDRLHRGEIAAIRCGITGKRCTACAGVPCFGSQPWDGG